MPAATFTIVTPVLNGEKFIAQTAASIFQQASPATPLAWLIVDGGSTDSTLAILNDLSPPAHATLSVMPDTRRGQAAAINLGLSHATGNILAWLGADDLYQPGAFAAVARDLSTQKPAWLIGDCTIINPAGQPIRRSVSRYKSRHLLAARDNPTKALSTLLSGVNFISQPAVFFNRPAFTATGPLDESLHYTMDYDLWLRLYRICPPTITTDRLASFRLHPASKSGQTSRDQFAEQLAVATRHTENPKLLASHRRRIRLFHAAYRVMKLLNW